MDPEHQKAVRRVRIIADAEAQAADRRQGKPDNSYPAPAKAGEQRIEESEQQQAGGQPQPPKGKSSSKKPKKSNKKGKKAGPKAQVLSREGQPKEEVAQAKPAPESKAEDKGGAVKKRAKRKGGKQAKRRNDRKNQFKPGAPEMVIDLEGGRREAPPGSKLGMLRRDKGGRGAKPVPTDLHGNLLPESEIVRDAHTNNGYYADGAIPAREAIGEKMLGNATYAAWGNRALSSRIETMYAYNGD